MAGAGVIAGAAVGFLLARLAGRFFVEVKMPGVVPVIVRFSDATGVPNIPDTHPSAAPHGMAIRFGLSGGAFTDIVALSHNGFVVGTGEDFLAFLKAIAATRPDSPHPSPVEAFLGGHPRALKFVMDNKPLPASFATLAYYGNNAFVFVDGKGAKRAGRYQIIPVAGAASLDSAAASKAGPNYLFDELPRRLAAGPVQFRLYAQFANPGDQTKDGSIAWPDDRQRVELGTISLTTVATSCSARWLSVRFTSPPASSSPTIPWCRSARPRTPSRCSTDTRAQRLSPHGNAPTGAYAPLPLPLARRAAVSDADAGPGRPHRRARAPAPARRERGAGPTGRAHGAPVRRHLGSD